MAKTRKSRRARTQYPPPAVSHRKWLVKELRADPELAAEYLNAAAQDEDPRVCLIALRTVAEAHGMVKVAKAAGMPRDRLQRALSTGVNLRLSTFLAILKVAGLKLTIQPLEPRTRSSR